MKNRLQSLLIPLLLIPLFAGCATVRHRLGTTLITPEVERQLGEQVAAQVEQQEKILDNAAVQDYVRQVAAPLVEQSLRDRPGVDYRITVLDQPDQVNAFAAPGGFLYVYSGLLLAAENEAELAGVLAHEIGHVVARHSANQLATQYGMEILTGLALGEDPAEIARIAAQLGSAGAMARFSRDDERQSDQYAVRYLAATGYDPSGLLTFFQKLQKLEGGKRSQVEKLLATHPATQERISRIEKMIAQSGAEGGKLEKERFLRQTAVLRR